VKKLLAIAAACVLAWAVMTRHHTQAPVAAPFSASAPGPASSAPAQAADLRASPEPTSSAVSPPKDNYLCDGRVYCSQMTSCDEAKYFLAHCPGVKMDGDGDGIPCERQFCGS
jgi:Excalibur calcium-binding domain